MFYRDYIIFHMIDRATRWHAAEEIANKTEETLLEYVYKVWIKVWGPPTNLHVDGESGLNTDAVKANLKRQGTQVHTRAPQQHARFIERRGAILRASMHITEEQCKRESVAVTFTQLLSTSVFAGNALVSVGDATPYQAVVGRQPAMLPPIGEPGSDP